LVAAPRSVYLLFHIADPAFHHADAAAGGDKQGWRSSSSLSLRNEKGLPFEEVLLPGVCGLVHKFTHA